MKDFDIIFPGKEMILYRKWLSFSRDVILLAQRRCTDHTGKGVLELLSQEDLNKGELLSVVLRFHFSFVIRFY